MDLAASLACCPTSPDTREKTISYECKRGTVKFLLDSSSFFDAREKINGCQSVRSGERREGSLHQAAPQAVRFWRKIMRTHKNLSGRFTWSLIFRWRWGPRICHDCLRKSWRKSKSAYVVTDAKNASLLRTRCLIYCPPAKEMCFSVWRCKNVKEVLIDGVEWVGSLWTQFFIKKSLYFFAPSLTGVVAVFFTARSSHKSPAQGMLLLRL